MKAKSAGSIVGYALEPYNGETDSKILVFVNVGYWGGDRSDVAPGTQNNASGFAQGFDANYALLNMSGNIYMTGNEILGVGRIVGLAENWVIETDGTMKTKGLLITEMTSPTGESIQTIAVTSPEVMITLTGTSILENDEIEVRFKDIMPAFSDVISTTSPIRVIVTPNGPVSLYVSEKDNEHFVVKRFGGDGNVVAFDWMVIAYRNGYEPKEEVLEAMVVEPASQASPVENLIDSSVQDEGGVSAEPPSEPNIEQPSSSQEDVPIEEPQTDEPVGEAVVAE